MMTGASVYQPNPDATAALSSGDRSVITAATADPAKVPAMTRKGNSQNPEPILPDIFQNGSLAADIDSHQKQQQAQTGRENRSGIFDEYRRHYRTAR